MTAAVGVSESGTARPMLVATFAFALACSSTRTLQRPLTDVARAELKEQLPSNVDVTWRDGSTVTREPALNLSIPGPNATWTHAVTRQKRDVPEAALQSIEWNSHGRGAGQGFLIGGIGAAVLGAVVGYASGDDPRCGSETYFCVRGSASEKSVVLGVLGFLGGGLVGALVGASAGSKTHLDLPP